MKIADGQKLRFSSAFPLRSQTSLLPLTLISIYMMLTHMSKLKSIMIVVPLIQSIQFDCSRMAPLVIPHIENFP